MEKNKKYKEKEQSELLPQAPPNALDIEEAVIGAMMLDKTAIHEVVEVLSSNSFYKEAHRIIYESIISLFQETGEPVDILTVSSSIRNSGELEKIGGVHYLMKLTQHIASSANISKYVYILKELQMRREAIQEARSLINNSYDLELDVFNEISGASQSLADIFEHSNKSSSKNMAQLIVEAIDTMQKDKENSSIIKSGFIELDKLIGGFKAGQMIVVGARPAMGKTSFALALARNISVDSELPVAIFSLEMTEIELANRYIAMETGINQKQLLNSEFSGVSYKNIKDRVTAISKAPIHIEDKSAINLQQLRAKCTILKRKHGIGVVVIDYLQLMTSQVNRNRNREQEISEISRGLKSLAKDLGVTVIVLSQLSRETEKRADKRPQLSDLRESGAIEQDADMVMFLHRPEYYNVHKDEDGNSTAGLAYVVVAKNRSGAVGTAKLGFDATITKFTNYYYGVVNDSTAKISKNTGFYNKEEFDVLEV
jgi:replicative DNA helicase